MIELPPEAMEAFNGYAQEQAARAAQVSLQIRRRELHEHLRRWLAKSMEARKANYEGKWNRWRRNARSIYDPARRAKKESWQSAFFVPITLQNKEIIKGTLYRTLVSGLPYGVKPKPSGSLDESQNIKDLTLREMEKSKLEVNMNDFLDDMLTYGAGFLKLFHERKFARRARRQPIYAEPTMETLQRMEMTGEPLPVIGYQKLPPELVQTYAGVRAYFVSIWDMFFEDGAKNVQSAPCAQRYRMALQEIKDGVAGGFFFEECLSLLQNTQAPPGPTEDKQQEAADFNRSTIEAPKMGNEREHICYEWWGLLPAKYVYIRDEDAGMQLEDPEALVPAKALFTNDALLAVDENDDYSAENPFLSSGYVHVPGTIYHMGVAELLEQIQDSINEGTNQRKDNVQLVMNRMFAILEKAIVSRADLVSRPGGAIRIKSGSTDDIRKAVQWLDTPDVTESSYLETQHEERYSQELTAANRVTIGSGGSSARDVTQTKGGMELLHQSSNDRLIYYAMVLEADLISDLIRRYYKLIYQNIVPEEIFAILGPIRAQTFILRSPEEIENDYVMSPEGVFSTMHQPVRIAQWQAFRDQYAGAPFFDDFAMGQLLARAIELPDADKVLVPMRDPVTGQPIPFQMMQQLALMAQMEAGAPQDPSGPGKAGAAGTTPRMPTTKVGRNGDRKVPS